MTYSSRRALSLIKISNGKMNSLSAKLFNDAAHPKFIRVKGIIPHNGKPNINAQIPLPPSPCSLISSTWSSRALTAKRTAIYSTYTTEENRYLSVERATFAPHLTPVINAVQ